MSGNTSSSAAGATGGTRHRIAALGLPSSAEASLVALVDGLTSRLHDNLVACLLYGSTVRGNFVPGVSDLNVLIVVETATAEAQAAIGEVARAGERISPFVLSRGMLARTARFFALKFLSIQRNYRILHGTDPLAGLTYDEGLVTFLAEQALRNLRLRTQRAFIVWGHDPKRYAGYLRQNVSNFTTVLSDVVRCAGVELPQAPTARPGPIGRTLGADASVLRDLLDLKRRPRPLTVDDVARLHARLFHVVDHAVRWIEQRWPTPSRP